MIPKKGKLYRALAPLEDRTRDQIVLIFDVLDKDCRFGSSRKFDGNDVFLCLVDELIHPAYDENMLWVHHEEEDYRSSDPYPGYNFFVHGRTVYILERQMSIIEEMTDDNV